MIQKDVTVLTSNEKVEKGNPLLGSEEEPYETETEETLLSSDCAVEEVKADEILNFKHNNTSKALRSLVPVSDPFIEKISKQKNSSEIGKDIFVFNGDEASVISLLIGLCVIAIVGVWFLLIAFSWWPFSAAAFIFWNIFFIAAILGLLIYAAVIGVLWDVLLDRGRIYPRG
jgi:hypothetical protein